MRQFIYKNMAKAFMALALIFVISACEDSFENGGFEVDSPSNVTAFKINGVNGTIDQKTGSINVTMPYGSEITAVIPEVSLQEGATANLDPEYGIPLMLEAVEELSTKYPRVGLLVIGPDEKAKDEFTPCKRLDHVHFTGPLQNEVVRDVMNHLTIFLRPTYFDGDSLSVREALAQGLPVIASDTGFRPPGALLFTKGRTNELIARIIYVLDNIQHVRAGIVRKGESDSAAALLNIYQSLADNKS